ncbi:MAG: hypothetical protein DI586_01970 [Micavibrio aeruginosavorus]|uniref:Uncharacterized protein n=1 Tax=Micavibrio aeruginosavorus TaxID=349221 RepID=A0A2W5FSZ5_9BACT|nr:MAG: hypothetical protein DI586_01970 [Micavibrio aeruginosavorus]
MRIRPSKAALHAAHGLLKKISADNLPVALRLKNSIFRLAKEFEQAHSHAPNIEELESDLFSRLTRDGKIRHYFNAVAAVEMKYPELYQLHCKRTVGHHRSTLHDIISGNISSIEEWIHQPEGKQYDKIYDKLKFHLLRYHTDACERILEHAQNVLNDPQYQGLVMAASRLAKTECEFVPALNFEDWLLEDDDKFYMDKFTAFADKLSVPVKYVYGMEDYLEFDKETLPFSLDCQLKIRDFLSYEIEDISELNRHASFASLLFGDYRSFTTYCQRWPNFFREELYFHHNLKNQNHFYDQNINYRQWGETLLKFGPQMLYYLDLFPDIGEMPRLKSGEINLKKTKGQIYDYLLATTPPEDAIFSDLRRFCFDNQLDNESYEGAKYLLSKCANLPNTSVEIPEISVDGENFGMPGYNFKMLSYEDYRVFFPGKFTGCCEKLYDHCRNSVIHSYMTRESGFYVLTDPSDRIIAHSWTWRSNEGYLVFDGFEAPQNDRRVTNKLIRNILDAFCEKLTDPRYADFDIFALVLGESGKGLRPHDSLPKLENITTIEGNISDWYSPEDAQILGEIEGYLGYSSSFSIFRLNPSYAANMDLAGPEPKPPGE